MLLRRILIVLPVLVLFVLTSLVFLAARAPRTWASHWSNPSTISVGTGQAEFGAVQRGAGWDLLWFNDDHARLMYTPSGRTPTRVQSGEIVQPTMVRSGAGEIAVWVKNGNGTSALEGTFLTPSRHGPIIRLLTSRDPIEHPYLFSSGSRVDVVFSWQARGPYESYLIRMDHNFGHVTAPVRLGSAEYYSFYPRAADGRDGSFGLLYLDACCHQDVWNVVYRSFSAGGRPTSKPHILYRILGFANGRQIPGQWGEEIRSAGGNSVIGAFVGDGGIWLFRADTHGHILTAPKLTNLEAGAPESLALVVTGTGATVLWEQANELGTYIETQSFDRALHPTDSPERVEYGSGSQTNPRAALSGRTVTVVWQTASRGVGSVFQSTRHEANVQPTLAQRLGLGLGNPWQELAVLMVGALGIATLTTTVNILFVFGLGCAGLFAMRIMRSYPGKWVTYAGLLTLALYSSFVAPGGPLFFLDTMPSMGLAAMPFGFLASIGALGFVAWVGTTTLRRIDDLYRIGIMAFLGVYFFAYVEATVFIQQRLGFI